MRRFADLLRYSNYSGLGAAGPGEAQCEAARLFPITAREHGIPLLDLSRPRPDAGTQVVIGVGAGYSIPDLELLDEIVPRLRGHNVELVDLSTPARHTEREELEVRLPGSTTTAQTPIVAVWTDGRLIRTELGKAARDFLMSRYTRRS